MQGSEKFWSLAAGSAATKSFDEVAGLELSLRSAPWLHASPYRNLLFARVAAERDRVPQDQQDRLQTFVRSFCHRAQGDATYATKIQELACLLRGIRERRPCSFKYERDDGKPREYRVEPLLMVLYKDRLYLLARKKPDAERRTFVLDAITSARVDDDGSQFSIADARYTDPVDVFRDSFGIFTDVSAPVDVEIEVRGSAATMLRRRKMHATQETSPRTNGWWSVRWHVASCPELRSFIASLFPNVRVVKPAVLAEEVSQLARDHLAIAKHPAGS
jgi:predicted DNA-binding transcriptional regulator YafY